MVEDDFDRCSSTRSGWQQELEDRSDGRNLRRERKNDRFYYGNVLVKEVGGHQRTTKAWKRGCGRGIIFESLRRGAEICLEV